MEVYKAKKLTVAILKRFQRNSIISLFLIPQLGILFYMVLLGNMANFLIFSSWMIKKYSWKVITRKGFFKDVHSDAV